MNLHILESTIDNYQNYLLFKKGDEKGLNYFFEHAFQPLAQYANSLIEDEFTSQTLVQESILKAWERRETMESMFHVFFFTRLTLRWLCHKYWREEKRGISGYRLISLNSLNDYDAPDYSIWQDEQRKTDNTQRLELIEKALAYLPPDRRNIVKLHFKYGMSCKSIASRYYNTFQQVSRELERSIEELRNITIRTRKKTKRTEPEKPLIRTDGDPLVAEITRLRKEKNLSFMEIASRLQISSQKAIEIYMEASKPVAKPKQKCI